jgi:hypothetical protein
MSQIIAQFHQRCRNGAKLSAREANTKNLGSDNSITGFTLSCKVDKDPARHDSSRNLALGPLAAFALGRGKLAPP